MDLFEKMDEMRENNTFFNDILSLNGSNQFDINEQLMDEKVDIDANEDTTEDNSYMKPTIDDISWLRDKMDSELDLSCGQMSNNELKINSTAFLEMRSKVCLKENLFSFHNKKQLFAKNGQNFGQKDKHLNNSLGLSPVRQELIRANNDNSFQFNSYSSFPTLKSDSNKAFDCDFDGIRVNSFESNVKTFPNDSQIFDESFKSLSKCSDLDLKADHNVDIDQTFLSPNSDFNRRSINSYFKQHSEPLSSIETFGHSLHLKPETINSMRSTKSDISLMNESFAPIEDQITSSDISLRIAQKRIDRKRQSLSRVDDFCENYSFRPSLNSTLNSYERTEDKMRTVAINDKTSITSGLGTSLASKTYSMPNISQSLALNQLLMVSPNVLYLRIGCFVEFKLNYLKVKNLSLSSFKFEVKVQANAALLNDLYINVPKNVINIPALFDGLLSDEITITPLKSGTFTIGLQIYPSIETINLPISPISVVCHIKAEQLVIKRPLYSSNATQIKYNLFENSIETQTIIFAISNKHFSGEIPLKFSLGPNKCFIFEPLYRHPDSAIHTYRIPDSQTLYLETKTQFEIRIAIRIQSFGCRQTDSCLTVSTDSNKSHVLAMFELLATFWPKRELNDKCLQCSERSLCLSGTKWKEIHFRNKSKENLIRVTLECTENKVVANNVIEFSSTQILIPPIEKVSIAIRLEKTFVKTDRQYNITVKYDSGFGKSLSVFIPVQII